jgi:hypothetical protein
MRCPDFPEVAGGRVRTGAVPASLALSPLPQRSWPVRIDVSLRVGGRRHAAAVHSELPPCPLSACAVPSQRRSCTQLGRLLLEVNVVFSRKARERRMRLDETVPSERALSPHSLFGHVMFEPPPPPSIRPTHAMVLSTLEMGCSSLR